MRPLSPLTPKGEPYVMLDYSAAVDIQIALYDAVKTFAWPGCDGADLDKPGGQITLLGELGQALGAICEAIVEQGYHEDRLADEKKASAEQSNAPAAEETRR